MSKNALGICYESSTIFRIRELVAKFWTVHNFWAEFLIDLRIARTDYGLSRNEYVSATNPNICQFLAIRGIRALCEIVIKQYFLHILSLETDKEPLLNQRKVENECISVFMTNLQVIMDFSRVAMKLKNPWWTAGLASDCATGPNEIILSYEYYR